MVQLGDFEGIGRTHLRADRQMLRQLKHVLVFLDQNPYSVDVQTTL